MFTFDNWILSYDGQVLAMQHDNKSRQIVVTGELPADFDWAMEVQVGTAWDAIVLSPVSGGLAALLTQDNLAYAGWYEMQLRGAQGDVVRRTNIIRVHVPRSLSGTGQWPTVPSEFLQIEQRIADLNEHPPKPGDNGFWLIWNVETDQYEPSDIPLPSGGGSGSDGGYYTPEVTQPSDNTMQVSFAASEDDMPPVEPVSVTLPAGPAGRDGADGTPGLPGQDGFSPTVQTEPIEGGTKVTITDATGPKEFEVMDGTNGQDGQPGRDGEPGAPGTPGRDGYSPIVQTAAIDGGTRVTITDADGPKTFDVLNGTNGEDGEPGQDGAPGQDGFSPTASVTQTEDGAKITITDKSGTTNATITNGKDGINGTDGADGQTPNIAPGNIETLPAGSDVTASITGQTPNLVLNLGIPQGPAGAGVPSTEGVPTDYLLSPSGWVAPPSGRGGTWRLIVDTTVDEDTSSFLVSQDAEGNPISLQEFYVLLDSEIATSNPATTCNVEINGIFQVNNAQFTNTEKKRYYYMYAKLIPNAALLFWHEWRDVPYNTGASLGQFLLSYREKPAEITSLRVTSTIPNKVIAGPGSRLRIWGVNL